MSSPPPSPSSSPGKTTRAPYIHPSLVSSPSSSPASSPKSSPVSSPSSSSSSKKPAPRQHTDSAVGNSYGPPSSGSRKRKASWSWYDILPKRFRPDEEEVEQEEKDMVNLVLQDNLAGLRKAVTKPPPMPFVEERAAGTTDAEERKKEAQNNPLYVAALINRVEAAKLLLANGWRMAEDRTMIHKADPYMKGYTALGVAFEKKNEVLEVFREHLIEMEEKYWSEESQKKRKEKQGEDKEEDKVTLKVPKRLKRSNSRGHFELSLSNSVVAQNPGGATSNSSDLVDLVLENNINELKQKVAAPPMLVLEEDARALSIEDRETRADENPLYVAAKIGREEAAELLLKEGWRMTEDRTRGGVDDFYLEGLTPLGVAYEKNFGVLDLFLNRVIDMEEGC